MLDVDDTLSDLSARGLVPPAWVLDGDLVISSTARRNRNIRVSGPGGSGYFLKQPDPLVPGSAETLALEARFYEFCHSEPAVAELARRLPPLVFRDESRNLLAVRLIPEARPLHAVYDEIQAGAPLPTAPLAALGRALGDLHRTLRRFGPAWLPSALPRAFQVHRPPLDVRPESSAADAELFRILQGGPWLGLFLDDLGAHWRPEAVIHGDIRSDNVLVGSSDAENNVWLIDWEFVQVGDPAWDVAAVLADHVALWTASIPQGPGIGLDQMAARARFPLEDIQPALRAFWVAYVAASGCEPGERLRRATAFSVLRLIMTALELAAEQDRLPAQAVLLLQVAFNLGADIERGRGTLYGIDAEAAPR